MLLLSIAWCSSALASGSDMPWEESLNQILESVQGPVAKIISVIIITVTGLTLAFGETSGGFSRLALYPPDWDHHCWRAQHEGQFRPTRPDRRACDPKRL
ncbi:hypothetical protein CT154_16150 [Komagataeibacter xylinus]|uniref:TrbC/VIRB2 family protein n=1 Tax=Komagataeibacter rhaeticus TaxID=215221 RepID=A0A858JKQ2_9PROT|nr:hypothetical protein CT154_16150 [Komagataeibacter xylinus]QIP37186.1 hypothetical protein GWK63_16250 [Komagataeibacter rhaeticus]QOC48316.1 TrbC/VirB2 family protein [Komagataeibacter rhaeticus]